MVVRELITKLGFRVETSGAKKYDGVIKTLKNDAIGAFHGIRTSLRLFSIASKIIWGKAIKDNFEYASSLTEVEDSLRRTFNELYDDIDKWSKEAGKQFGLSELQAKRYNMSMGAILKTAGITSPQFAEMSKELVGLSADLASFYNISNDSAMHKIRSAMSGYTIGLRQLGINMSDVDIQDYLMTQGIKKSYYQMTDAEKYIARYNFLLSRTVMIQGDFENALEGSFYNYKRLLASKWQNIAEKIFHGATPQAIRFAREVRFIFESVERRLGDLEVELGLFWGKLARRVGKFYFDLINLIFVWRRETNNFEGTRNLIEALGRAFKKTFGFLGNFLKEHGSTIDKFLGKLGDLLNFLVDHPEILGVLLGAKFATPLLNGLLGFGGLTGAGAGIGAGAGAGAVGGLMLTTSDVLLFIGAVYLFSKGAKWLLGFAKSVDESEFWKNWRDKRDEGLKSFGEKVRGFFNWGTPLDDYNKGFGNGEDSQDYHIKTSDDKPKSIWNQNLINWFDDFGDNIMEALMESGKTGNEYIQRKLGVQNNIQNQNNNITNNINVTTTSVGDAEAQANVISQALGVDLANRINNVGSKIPAPSY